MKAISVVVLIFTLNFEWAFAEIQRVEISWNPALCPKMCLNTLNQRLVKIPAVLSVDLDQANGEAELAWKTTSPFSFTPLNLALRWVGIRENDVRVQLRGKVSIQGSTYSIISEGDRTLFVLFGPVFSNLDQYVEEKNPANRPLAKTTIEQLKEAKKNNNFVIARGSLFMPYRSPPEPLRLIVGEIRVLKESLSEQKKSSKNPLN